MHTNYKKTYPLYKLLLCCIQLLTLTTLLLSQLSSAFAQDNVGDDSTIIYSADYFVQWAPVTALDMINRIPGMNIESSAGSPGSNASRGGRGLGSGGGGTVILINGKRTAGKNNNTQGQLVRINANQVQRIEIIRGTGGELDVRGSTQIANIVMSAQQSSSSISYDINADYYSDKQTEPGGSLSYSAQTGDLNVLVNASAEPQYEHRESFERSVLGDFSLNDTVTEERIRDQTTYTLSTNLDYRFSEQTSARFNALYAENDNPTTIERLTVNLQNTPNTLASQREELPGKLSNWEIGGDFEHRFNSGSRLKTLLIANENDTANTRERYDVFGDGTESINLFLDSSNTIQERILRASYTMDLIENHNLEFGAESAQTILNSELRLGLPLSTGTPSEEFGGLVPSTVQNANTRVEEIRYEPFLIHNWRINSRMSLETALVYEFSEIEQSGDSSNKRDFSFFKPKIDYRFDITPQLQLRILVEKIVRQINFVDFVAVTDSEDDDSNTLAGNTDLRPDFWWNYNLLAEYRLPNDIGVVSANIYQHNHKDFKQRIDASTSATKLASAVGNIGSGTMNIMDLKGSVRLSTFGMPNVLVTSLVSIRDSEVFDPFLEEERSFNNYHRGQFDIGFRHDIPAWKMNYGLKWNNRFDGDFKRWDIDDIESDTQKPFVTAFLEVTAFSNTILRLDIDNLSDSPQCRERERYLGHVRDQILEELEKRCSNTGRIISFKVSGNF